MLFKRVVTRPLLNFLDYNDVYTYSSCLAQELPLPEQAKISLYTILQSKDIMGRGYHPEKLREKLIETLEDSKIGMSGVEISEKLGINRSTMTKYLKVFAAERLLRQKNIGNITLWSLEAGQESYDFPADYFKVAPQFLDLLLKYSEDGAYTLIKNCLYSGATVEKLISEVIVPAISSVDRSFGAGKIGSSEQKFVHNIISNSLQIFTHLPAEPNPKKSIVIISADPQSNLLSEAATSTLRSGNWSVFHLGDMSSAINVLFDLDFQKLLGKISRPKSGITAILVFSSTEMGLNFFSDSVRSIRQKSKKSLKIVLCGKVAKKTKIESDFISAKFDEIIQWSKTISAGLEK